MSGRDVAENVAQVEVLHAEEASDNTGSMSVAIIICCHNRKLSTISCLRSVMEQEGFPKSQVTVYLVDDGSSDGTAQSVADEFPSVNIIYGSGELYWARAMGAGEAYARRDGADVIVWLNDDTRLVTTALEQLCLTSHRYGHGAVIVGATSGECGEITYTGARRVGSSPTRLRRILPAGREMSIDAFNGNIVWVPRGVVEKIGGINTDFTHAYADNEYGMRCRRAGIDVLLAPQVLGSCERNSGSLGWTNRSISRRMRIKILFGRKGLPVKDHWLYISLLTDSQMRAYWNFASSYGKAMIGALK